MMQLAEINKIYCYLPSGELDVVRVAERKNIALPDETKQKVLASILGGMTQAAAAKEHGVSNYIAFSVLKAHKEKEALK